MSIEKSAPLMCAGITVFAPLFRNAKFGKKCAVIGIGGLGHVKIMICYLFKYLA